MTCDKVYLVVTAHAGIINDCEMFSDLKKAVAYAEILGTNDFSDPEQDDVKVFNEAGVLVHTPQIGKENTHATR